VDLLNGRINRSTYWLGLVIIMSVFVLLRVAGVRASVSEVVLVCLAVPRLHDVGRSGWWAGAAFAFELAAMVLVFVVGLASNASTVFVNDGLGIVVLIVLGAMGVLGFWPGSQSENRFGPPPAVGISFRPLFGGVKPSR
jgi:uncharacterized membrane protein YhaH (DUF805 family)